MSCCKAKHSDPVHYIIFFCDNLNFIPSTLSIVTPVIYTNYCKFVIVMIKAKILLLT